MRTDLAASWKERLTILAAQIETASGAAYVWHWRAEFRVLRFLVSRYGHNQSPQSQASAEVCIEPAIDEPTLLPMSALQRALVKMALLTPRLQSKHPRPTERNRAAILERLKDAGDEAREITDEEKRWLKHFDRASYRELEARQKNERQRQQEKQWKADLRQRKEQERARRQ